MGDYLFQAVQEPDPGHRASDRDGSADAGNGQVPRLLFGNDLRGFFGGRKSRKWKYRRPLAVSPKVFQISSRRREEGVPAPCGREGVVNQAQPKHPRLRLAPQLYEQLRNQVLRRDGWRCQACGTTSNLEVHHKEFRSQSGNDSEQNLITLCTTCHASVH